MNPLNFIGYLIIVLLLVFLYHSSNTGPFIFKNNKVKKIEIHRDFFKPNNIVINPGDEIIWKNHDYVLRHVVVNDDVNIRNSDVLMRGDEYKVIFDRPGEYIFYSSLYPNFEKGIVKVKEVKSGGEFKKNLKDNMLNVVLNVYRILLKSVKKMFNLLLDLIKKFYSMVL